MRLEIRWLPEQNRGQKMKSQTTSGPEFIEKSINFVFFGETYLVLPATVLVLVKRLKQQYYYLNTELGKYRTYEAQRYYCNY